MAALQTNTFVDGHWQTTSMDVEAVLKHHQEQDRLEERPIEHVNTPVYGLLTRTVIESPVVNWILPARIRHMDKNDVVFIGDYSIHLRELHADEHFRDIASKSDFDSRIRSAIVIGDIPPIDARPSSSEQASEDSEMGGVPLPSLNSSSASVDHLPPQYIVLALESGDMVFLYVRDDGLENSEVQFVMKRHTLTGEMLRIQPGAHLTVDPSARYIALSCYQSLFAIYELRSKSELSDQYANDKEFNPVKRERYMFTDGIVHKIEFLYPSFEEMNRIILLMLVINGGKTKMFVYVWDAGDEMGTIEPQNPRGHRVHKDAAMPILLIPLRIKSNFLLVSEDRMMLYKGIIEDMPECVAQDASVQETSKNHHGARPPMFTAWARPRRLKTWAYTHDHIYIAREDGRIKSLEIHSENDIEGIMDAGTVDCNIGRAFACVDFAHQASKKGKRAATSTRKNDNDILVIGGDMSNGGIFSVAARSEPEKKDPIWNWSPTLDFVVVPTGTARCGSLVLRTNDPEMQGYKGKSNDSEARISASDEAFSRPDRIFACSGKGKNGAIVELRYGLEACVDFEIPLAVLLGGLTIRKTWTIPDVADDGQFLVLATTGRSSEILHLSANNSADNALQQLEESWLNQDSSTILIEQIGDFIIQVTEVGILLSNLPLNSETAFHESHRIESSPASFGKTYVDAVIQNNVLFVTTRIGLGTQIEMKMFRITPEDESLLSQLFEPVVLDSDPTCIILADVDGELNGFYALASKPGHVYTIDMKGNTCEIALGPGVDQHQVEEVPDHVCHSLAVIPNGRHKILLCGFRNGSFRTYVLGVPNKADRLSNYIKTAAEFSCLKLIPRDSTQLGTTGVTIYLDPLLPEAAFLQCDSDVYRFAFDIMEGEDEMLMSSLQRIWHTWTKESKDPVSPQPFVNSVTSFNDGGHQSNGKLLITSDTTLIVSSLDPRPKAVPRTMVIGATPTSMFYAEHLDAFVVAVILPTELHRANSSSEGSTDGQSTIFFINPESGRNMSAPQDEDRKPVQFISGLGKNEKLLCLREWKYVKNDVIFQYILIGSSYGRLIIVSTNLPRRTAMIVHWTRTIIKLKKGSPPKSVPIYSFAGTNDGLFICASEMLVWRTPDANKKFRQCAIIDLPSPGLSIEVQGNLIKIVTARHSLIVVKYCTEQETLTPYLTDQISRNGLRQLATPNYPITLISDRTLCVSGLWYEETSYHTDAVTTVFEAELKTAILKFQLGTPRKKLNKLCPDDVELLESREDTTLTTGQLGKTLGMGIDGSVHHFEVLPQSIWVLLRYIQNMAMHSPKICPFTYDRVARDEFGNYQIEPLPVASPMSSRQVNGDILVRCKQLGRKGFTELLQQELPDDMELLHENTDARHERHERLLALVGDCLSKDVDRETWDVYWEAYKLMCWHLLPVI